MMHLKPRGAQKALLCFRFPAAPQGRREPRRGKVAWAQWPMEQSMASMRMRSTKCTFPCPMIGSGSPCALRFARCHRWTFMIVNRPIHPNICRFEYVVCQIPLVFHANPLNGCDIFTIRPLTFSFLLMAFSSVFAAFSFYSMIICFELAVLATFFTH